MQFLTGFILYLAKLWTYFGNFLADIGQIFIGINGQLLNNYSSTPFALKLTAACQVCFDKHQAHDCLFASLNLGKIYNRQFNLLAVASFTSISLRHMHSIFS